MLAIDVDEAALEPTLAPLEANESTGSLHAGVVDAPRRGARGNRGIA